VSDDQRTQQDKPSAFEEAGGDVPPSLVQEFWQFILENKAWWMVPIILALAIVGLFVVLGSTGAAPFIYTLF
jgi:hypothetical protein